MATYKDGTLKKIQIVQQAQGVKVSEITVIENGEAVKQILLEADGIKMVIKKKSSFASEVLNITGDPEKVLSKGDKALLARYTGKDVTLLYHVTNDNKSNMPSRDMVLCAALLRDTVPNAEDVDHAMMVVQRAELFTSTHERSENQRNLVLRRCLDYAHATGKCPVENWLAFTNSVILLFNTQLGLCMPLVGIVKPDFRFLEEQEDIYEPLLRGWEKELKNTSFCYLSDLRQKLLYAYMEKHSKSKEEALTELASNACYDSGYAKQLFSDSPKSGSRDVLIAFAIALGCNLDETNMLLRQVGEHPLYLSANAEDAEHIHKLSQEGLGVIQPKNERSYKNG